MCAARAIALSPRRISPNPGALAHPLDNSPPLISVRAPPAIPCRHPLTDSPVLSLVTSHPRNRPLGTNNRLSRLRPAPLVSSPLFSYPLSYPTLFQPLTATPRHHQRRHRHLRLRRSPPNLAQHPRSGAALAALVIAFDVATFLFQSSTWRFRLWGLLAKHARRGWEGAEEDEGKKKKTWRGKEIMCMCTCIRVYVYGIDK